MCIWVSRHQKHEKNKQKQIVALASLVPNIWKVWFTDPCSALFRAFASGLGFALKFLPPSNNYLRRHWFCWKSGLCEDCVIWYVVDVVEVWIWWWLLRFYDSAHIKDDDCRSGSLPEILQYRVWPVSRTETFNTQVHWPNLQRRHRAQPSVRN